MKTGTAPLFFSLFLFFLATGSPVFSGVEVLMKNGAGIRAESCEKIEGRFKCFNDDGTFYLEESDVVRVREAEGVRKDAPMAESPLLQDRESVPIKEEKSGPEMRLDQIRQRKSELMSERERLLSERRELQEDIKNAADWMPVKQFEELKGRNSELDEKIRAFNEEVKSLDEEENRVAGPVESKEK